MSFLRPFEVPSWNEFKALQSVKMMNLQYDIGAYQNADVPHFLIVGPDADLTWTYKMPKGGTEQAEFDAYYKAGCNYAVSVRGGPFATDDFSLATKKFLPVECVGDTLNMDIDVLEEGLYVNGGCIVGKDFKVGDWIETLVVDKYGCYYPPETILRTWGELLIDPYNSNKCKLCYAGNPPGGTVMRVVFNKAERALGEPDPVVGWSCYMHRRAI